ncbi:hypothetical protein COCCADRAFT_9490 [Bipolaris zeicola 26-R-13]|uniref:Uncharacterized protein n=1 Tax=Cochliobolus carbonum (strain 26-R-13) TaxID=930089 RepID=W6XR33_COCC2|nr:uncharacterized protein COCCADRAFT_9490 [Bipolaris zeicola 26-R-13]EUC28068.1 hypothetical protein COCCADRAFT_9490 [Bipolaris zeicola 26-R-13]
MDNVSEFLAHLYEFPEGEFMGPEVDQEQFLVHWGYTIYRTYYGPASDEKWAKLLKNIINGVENSLNELERGPPIFVVNPVKCASQPSENVCLASNNDTRLASRVALDNRFAPNGIIGAQDGTDV